MRAHPAHPAARAGLAALWGEFDPTLADGFSFYLIEAEHWGGSAGTLEQLIVTDPGELRWACEGSYRMFGHLSGYLLTTCASGERLGAADLAPVVEGGDGLLNWDSVPIPPLPNAALPVGHPAQVDGNVVHYGWGGVEIG
ncbi:hypothetical protein [Sphaerisporangium perillae]|uniref:hypothetical protein n=1 Tax=Sphaerisporangium perillae TaxID=2935860 RepID=UPI00200C16D1|nr:hypothetical protein [Sphaerisporangium perillae]